MYHGIVMVEWPLSCRNSILGPYALRRQKWTESIRSSQWHQHCAWGGYRRWLQGTGLVRWLLRQGPRGRTSARSASPSGRRDEGMIQLVKDNSQRTTHQLDKSFRVSQSTVAETLAAFRFVSKLSKWVLDQLTEAKGQRGPEAALSPLSFRYIKSWLISSVTWD